MSRIGKVPVYIPEGVEVLLDSQNNFVEKKKFDSINIKGPLGKLTMCFNPKEIAITLTEDQISLNPLDIIHRAKWGTYRTLVEQMIIGVSQGYMVNLELIGVGYKASVEDNKLTLKLGFSHDIIHKIPEGISIVCRKPTFLSILGINKQKVHEEASKIRSYKKPEPYKGKGILYENETILRKEGKKK